MRINLILILALMSASVFTLNNHKLAARFAVLGPDLNQTGALNLQTNSSSNANDTQPPITTVPLSQDHTSSNFQFCDDIGWVQSPSPYDGVNGWQEITNPNGTKVHDVPTHKVEWCYNGAGCSNSKDFVVVSVRSWTAYINCRQTVLSVLNNLKAAFSKVVEVTGADGVESASYEITKRVIEATKDTIEASLPDSAQATDGCDCFPQRWTSTDGIFATITSDADRGLIINVTKKFEHQVDAENVQANTLLQVVSCTENVWRSAICDKYTHIRTKKTMSWSDLADELATFGDGKTTSPPNLWLFKKGTALNANCASQGSKTGQFKNKWCFNNAGCGSNYQKPDYIEVTYTGSADIKCESPDLDSIPALGSLILSAYGLNGVTQDKCVCYPAPTDSNGVTVYVNDESGDYAYLSIDQKYWWGLMLDTIKNEVVFKVTKASEGNWKEYLVNRWKEGIVNYEYDWDEFGDDIAWVGDRNAIADGISKYDPNALNKPVSLKQYCFRNLDSTNNYKGVCAGDSYNDYVHIKYDTNTKEIISVIVKDDSADWVELIPDPSTSKTKFDPENEGIGGVKKGAILKPKECSAGNWQRNICDRNLAFYVHCSEIRWGTFGDHVAWIGDHMMAKSMDCIGYKEYNPSIAGEVQKLYCFNSKGCPAYTPDWITVFYDSANANNKITRMKVQDASGDYAQFSIQSGTEKFSVLDEGTSALKRGAIVRYNGCSSGNWQSNICGAKRSFAVLCDSISWQRLGDLIANVGDKNDVRYDTECIGYQLGDNQGDTVFKTYCFNSARGCGAADVINVYLSINNPSLPVTKVTVSDESGDTAEFSVLNGLEKFSALDGSSNAVKKGATIRPTSCSSGNWQNNICGAKIGFLVKSNGISWAWLGDTVANKGDKNANAHDDCVFPQPTDWPLGEITSQYCHNSAGCGVGGKTNDYVYVFYDVISVQVKHVKVMDASGDWADFNPDNGLDKYDALNTNGLKKAAWLRPKSCSSGNWQNRICGRSYSFAIGLSCSSVSWGQLGEAVAWMGDQDTRRQKDCISIVTGGTLEYEQLYCFNSAGCGVGGSVGDYISIYYDSNSRVTRLYERDASGDWAEFGVDDGGRFNPININGVLSGATIRPRRCSGGNWQNNICNGVSLIRMDRCGQGSWDKLGDAIAWIGDRNDLGRYSCLSILPPHVIKRKEFCHNSAGCGVGGSKKDYIYVDYWDDTKLVNSIQVTDESGDWANFQPVVNIQFNENGIYQTGRLFQPTSCSGGNWQKFICGVRRNFYNRCSGGVSWQVMGNSIAWKGDRDVNDRNYCVYNEWG